MNVELAATTIPELLRARASKTPQGKAISWRVAPGRWSSTTWSELLDSVLRRAAWLESLGIAAEDRVAIWARTRTEWQVAELAGLFLGASIVGVDAHATGVRAETILKHCEPRCLIADTREQAKTVSQTALAKLRAIITLDADSPPEPHGPWHLWPPEDELPPTPADARFPTLDASRPAALLYTSGTTGEPRAIEYSHGHLMAACRAICGAFPGIGFDDSLLCWLPMSHLFQRMLNLVAIARGAAILFAEDPRKVLEYVGEAHPSVFTAVPRFYEKLHEGVQQRLARQPRLTRGLAKAALRAGEEFSRRLRAREPLPWTLRLRHRALNTLVLRRIRRAMGRNIKFMITGSAPVSPRLLESLHALGWLVLEAYGVSENTVPMALNRLDDFRFGSVGKPLAENELRIADDGEILVRGPGVFSGYWRSGEAVEPFTEDGFYKTGDLGYLDADGFLFLKGRKTEMIKTSTGRLLAPARIESVYRQCPFIDQVVVFGDGRKCLVGLVTLLRDPIRAKLGPTTPDPQRFDQPGWTRLPEVARLARDEINVLGEQLAPHERVSRFAILEEPLSVSRGELTTTLKLRRRAIAERHADLIERLHAEPTPEAGGQGIIVTP